MSPASVRFGIAIFGGRMKTFETWLEEFIEALGDSGMPVRQAEKYRDEHLEDAQRYFENKFNPLDAAFSELEWL